MDDVQQLYTQPMQDTSPMSVKDWMITLLLVSIPLVGIIMLFVWAFGSGHNLNKSNFSKAALLWYAILIVLYILFFVILFGVIGLD